MGRRKKLISITVEPWVYEEFLKEKAQKGLLSSWAQEVMMKAVINEKYQEKPLFLSLIRDFFAKIQTFSSEICKLFHKILYFGDGGTPKVPFEALVVFGIQTPQGCLA